VSGRSGQRGGAAGRGREKHVARYKLPKAVLFRQRIERSPSGKPDYVWARAQVEAEP
jgi:fatty-acyl-CoA synthase